MSLHLSYVAKKRPLLFICLFICGPLVMSACGRPSSPLSPTEAMPGPTRLKKISELRLQDYEINASETDSMEVEIDRCRTGVAAQYVVTRIPEDFRSTATEQALAEELVKQFETRTQIKTDYIPYDKLPLGEIQKFLTAFEPALAADPSLRRLKDPSFTTYTGMEFGFTIEKNSPLRSYVSPKIGLISGLPAEAHIANLRCQANEVASLETTYLPVLKNIAAKTSAQQLWVAFNFIELRRLEAFARLVNDLDPNEYALLRDKKFKLANNTERDPARSEEIEIDLRYATNPAVELIRLLKEISR